MFYLRRERVVFVHIPRTGGGSICRALFKAKLMQSKTKWIHDRRGDTKVGGHATASVLRERLCDPPFDDCLSFAIVREPYSRAISLWRATRKYQENRGGGPRDDGLSLDAFVCEWIMGGKLNKNLRRPQWKMVSAGGECLVDGVFRFEDGLGPVAAFLSVALGREIRVGHAAQYSQPGDLDMLTGSNRRALRQYYRDDFKRFGYET